MELPLPDLIMADLVEARSGCPRLMDDVPGCGSCTDVPGMVPAEAEPPLLSSSAEAPAPMVMCSGYKIIQAQWMYLLELRIYDSQSSIELIHFNIL